MNAQTDLFELWPSDGIDFSDNDIIIFVLNHNLMTWNIVGYVNGLRANLPLGVVIPTAVTYTSTNGCKLGKCDDGKNGTAYTGNCFEPNDVFKGYYLLIHSTLSLSVSNFIPPLLVYNRDIARSYFYLSVAYMDEWSCCDVEGVNKSDIKPWMEDILRSWHRDDPVDYFETVRNDAIYNDWQKNRNPFIDHPEWVQQISDFWRSA